MATVTIRPTGAATARPPFSPGGTLTGVIGGTGDLGDDSDSTYVEVVRRVIGHFGSGQDRFDATSGYNIDLPPTPDLGPFPTSGLVDGRAVLECRARIEVVAYDIEYLGDLPSTAPSLFGGRVQTSAGAFLDGPDLVPLVNLATPVGEPVWLTNETFVASDAWEALRTGTYPGVGEIGLYVGFLATPAVTPPNDVGDETRIRLYEAEWTYVTTEDVVRPATRMFPRDDALGLSSAPRLVPPPKARRVVGGYL